MYTVEQVMKHAFSRTLYISINNQGWDPSSSVKQVLYKPINSQGETPLGPPFLCEASPFIISPTLYKSINNQGETSSFMKRVRKLNHIILKRYH